MKDSFFDQNISYYLNIKKQTISALQRLGITKVKHLILHKPNYYKFIKLLPKICDVKKDDEVILKIEIIDYLIPKKKNSPFKIKAKTLDSDIMLIFFKHNVSILKQFPLGSYKYICGKIEFHEFAIQIFHPNIIYDISKHTSIEPVYPLTYGISNYQIWSYISKIIDFMPSYEEWLPEDVIDKYKLIKFREAINILHALKTTEQNSINIQDKFSENLNLSYMRIKIDEIFANQIMLEKIRYQRNLITGNSFLPKKNIQQLILNNLSFELTQDQKKSIEEIETDQSSSRQMFRMLQGDVGSGKTLVALLTAVNVIMDGYQVAIMAPTDVLAKQHYNFFCKALDGIISEKNFAAFELENLKEKNIDKFKKLDQRVLEFCYNNEGVKLGKNGDKFDDDASKICNEGSSSIIAYLSGSTNTKTKKNFLEKIKYSKAKIIIGTHALFQEKVIFNNLAYIIVDEQHRFGVNQRIELANKAKNPDILIMSATPIPRSLSITIFGDMLLSEIKTKPKGRKEIITSIISDKKIEELIIALQKKIINDERIYWICPLIENKDEEIKTEKSESYTQNLSNVTERYNKLNKIYPNLVGVLHGKMKIEDKEVAINNFKAGIVKILVSTTVVEVGVDVPEASLIIIENAERFGLAQLHQLRGRVGRGNIQSSCILIYGKFLSKIGKERLKILKESNDGFYLAEKDLILRGSGEMLGEKQSGEENFKFLNLSSDSNIIIYVNKIVKNISFSNFNIIKKYNIVTDIFNKLEENTNIFQI